MNEDPQVRLSVFVDLLHRYRLVMICAFAVGLSFTLITARFLPRRFVSSTMVMIEPQLVSSQYVADSVTSHIEDRLQMLEHVALSRTQLEDLITRFKLYPAMRRDEPIEDVVDYMRRHITVDITPNDNSRVASGLFRLDFEYGDSRIAQRVTAKLADVFIDQDFKQRAREAADTTQFLGDQLGTLRSQLQTKEQEIKVFKGKFQGSLPQDLQANINLASDLKSQLEKVNEDLAVWQDREIQISRDEGMAHDQQVTITAPNGERSAATPEAALRSMKTQFTILRAQYSENYPDVIELKAQIAALEEQIKKNKGASAGGEGSFSSPLSQRFRAEHDAMTLERARLEDEQNVLGREITALESRIGATPAVAEQLSNLMRDYNVLSFHYESLLKHELAAQMAQTLEQRQEGERFQIVDPASLPAKALPPDTWTLLALGTLASLGFALGVPFLLGLLDRSVKDPEELRVQCNAPVLATIPHLREVEGSWPRYLSVGRTLAISVACLVVGGGTLWLFLINL